MTWDDFVEHHFQNWLEVYVHPDERDMTEKGIRSLIARDPELLANHSWDELRDMAEKGALAKNS